MHPRRISCLAKNKRFGITHMCQPLERAIAVHAGLLIKAAVGRQTKDRPTSKRK